MRRDAPLPLSPRILSRSPLWMLALLGLLALAGCDTSPHQRPFPPQSGAIAQRAEERQCLAALAERHAAFTPLPDQYTGPGCSALGTVHLYSLDGDSSAIAVGNLAQVGCPIANGFANWVRFGVDRAARQILGSGLVRVETMGSYACRNIAGSDMRSAHATASAIDVSGFTLADGRRITVMGQWSAGSAEERHFWRVIHASACKRFGTVLGPDYNLAHRNHLHIEMSATAFCR